MSARIFIAALLAMSTFGCVSEYAAAPDGRASVIDLVMFPSAYADQQLVTQGYLRWTEAGAQLYFVKEHMTRRSTRFVLAVDPQTAEIGEALRECDGQEILLKGVLDTTAGEPRLQASGDFVC